MTLSDYIQKLKGDVSYHQLAKDSGISSNTWHKLIKDKKRNPTPDILMRIASYYGSTQQEQQNIYADLMRLSGYLDMMPQSIWPSLNQSTSDEILVEPSSFYTNLIPEVRMTLKELSELQVDNQRDIATVLQVTLKLTKRVQA